MTKTLIILFFVLQIFHSTSQVNDSIRKIKQNTVFVQGGTLNFINDISIIYERNFNQNKKSNFHSLNIEYGNWGYLDLTFWNNTFGRKIGFNYIFNTYKRKNKYSYIEFGYHLYQGTENRNYHPKLTPNIFPNFNNEFNLIPNFSFGNKFYGKYHFLIVGLGFPYIFKFGLGVSF
ncbi:MAG: hypothetical protein V4622_06990 [Bacteroidota bacterium]